MEEEACWESSSPRKKRRSGWCSSSASFSCVLRRCSGEVEGLQWWGRVWSSSMVWGLREKVRGVNEGERELGEGSQEMEGRADVWGRG